MSPATYASFVFDLWRQYPSSFGRGHTGVECHWANAGVVDSTSGSTGSVEVAVAGADPSVLAFERAPGDGRWRCVDGTGGLSCDELAATCGIVPEADQVEIRSCDGSPSAEPFVGVQWRLEVAQAKVLIKLRRFDEGEALLGKVVRAFEQMAEPGAEQISVETPAQLEQAIADRPARSLLAVDGAYGDALFVLGTLAVERGDVQTAITYLDRDIALRPFSPMAHIERGFIQLKLQAPGPSLETYRRALALAVRPAHRAQALRGIGFAQFELGDLEAARASYVESQTFDPTSPVARHEIEYIDQQLRARSGNP